MITQEDTGPTEAVAEVEVQRFIFVDTEPTEAVADTGLTKAVTEVGYMILPPGRRGPPEAVVGLKVTFTVATMGLTVEQTEPTPLRM